MKYLKKIRLIRSTIVAGVLALIALPFILGPRVSQYMFDECKLDNCTRHGIGAGFLLLILEFCLIFFIALGKVILFDDGLGRRIINWITANDIKEKFIEKI